MGTLLTPLTPLTLLTPLILLTLLTLLTPSLPSLDSLSVLAMTPLPLLPILLGIIQAGSGVEGAKDSALDKLNHYRALHGASKVKLHQQENYDAYIAAKETCENLPVNKFDHSGTKSPHNALARCNFATCKTMEEALKNAVDKWYKREAELYCRNGYYSNGVKGNQWFDVGHFAALVWKSATKYGMWAVRCDKRNQWVSALSHGYADRDPSLYKKNIGRPSTCSTGKGGTTCFEENTDYRGNDMGAYIIKTAAECQQFCKETGGCRYFTFSPSDNKCYLKTGNKKEYKKGLISGPATCGSKRALVSSVFGVPQGGVLPLSYHGVPQHPLVLSPRVYYPGYTPLVSPYSYSNILPSSHAILPSPVVAG